jgi:hypothetical protein
MDSTGGEEFRDQFEPLTVSQLGLCSVKYYIYVCVLQIDIGHGFAMIVSLGI